MKPPFPWYGGKKNVKDHILRQIRKILETKRNTKQIYFEPFVGGGTLLFELLPKRAVISDINCWLMNLYHVIKTDCNALLRFLDNFESEEDRDSYEFFTYNTEKFNKMRKSVLLNSLGKPSKQEVEMAARFYYMCKRGFGGIINVLPDGTHKVRYAQTKIDNRYLYDIDNLKQVSEYLARVRLSCGDYSTILKHAKKGDIVYIDPPYYTDAPPQDNYWINPFNHSEQKRLRDYVKALDAKGVHVLVSNSDHKEIRKLYCDFKVHKIKLRRTVNMTSNKVHTEVLITNF